MEVGNAVAKDQEKDPDIAALQAKIGITLDELKRLPASVRTNVDKPIAEKLEASYAADEAKRVAEVTAAEADQAIVQAMASMAEEELASMLGPENLPTLQKSFLKLENAAIRCCSCQN